MMTHKASPAAQRGMTFWSMLFVFGVIAFFAIITMKVVPIYLNQMKISNSVEETAKQAQVDSATGQVSFHQIQDGLAKRWDIEDVDYLDWRDVQMVNTDHGRVLSYDYEARVHLFYNIFIVVHFAQQVPLPGGGGGD